MSARNFCGSASTTSPNLYIFIRQKLTTKESPIHVNKHLEVRVERKTKNKFIEKPMKYEKQRDSITLKTTFFIAGIAPRTTACGVVCKTGERRMMTGLEAATGDAVRGERQNSLKFFKLIRVTKILLQISNLMKYGIFFLA